MGSWLLQVAGFTALIINLFLGGALVEGYFGPSVATVFELIVIGGYLGFILVPLMAQASSRE